MVGCCGVSRMCIALEIKKRVVHFHECSNCARPHRYIQCCDVAGVDRTSVGLS